MDRLPTTAPTFPGPPIMSLLVHLEDLVLADFGAGELSAVRSALAARPCADLPEVGRLKQFLDTLAVVQHREVDQVYVWAGTRLTAVLAKECPALLRGHTSIRTVLLQLNQASGSALAELLPEATAPDFWEEYLDATTIRVGFDGPIEVKWLLEGITGGLAGIFGERVETRRGVAPAALPDRRLVDIQVVPDRRGMARSTAGVTSAGSRG